LIFEWETLFPFIIFFPVIWQIRDIAIFFSIIILKRSAKNGIIFQLFKLVIDLFFIIRKIFPSYKETFVDNTGLMRD
jgi:hypothetical protein